MATTQPELAELYNKKVYKVVTQRTEDKEGEIRCRRAVPVSAYIDKLKSSLENLDEIVIMGAGQAVAVATQIGEIARNILPNLHQVVVKGKEQHSFLFAKVDNEAEQVTRERDVEYIRIRIIKNSKVTDEDKKSEGYTAPPENVSDESLTEAIKSARILTSRRSNRPNNGPRNNRRPRKENNATEGEETTATKGQRRNAGNGPNRRRNPNNRKSEGAPPVAAEGENAVPANNQNNRRRGPRRNFNKPKKVEGATAEATA